MCVFLMGVFPGQFPSTTEFFISNEDTTELELLMGDIKIYFS